MEVFVNDLSIAGQFTDIAEFRAVLEPFLKFRKSHPDFENSIYCSEQFSNRPINQEMCIRDAVLASGDRLFKGLVLAWLGRGPFWEPDRTPHEDDLFYFEQDDVTNQGLGEATRRIILGIQAGAFSFTHERFQTTPLQVTHGLLEAPFGVADVPNFWTLDTIEKILTPEVPSPSNWEEFVIAEKGKRGDLIFAEEIGRYVAAEPFDLAVSRQIMQRLDVLNRLAMATSSDGSLSKEGKELWQKHFVGENAWFSDESDSNKETFKSEMTFKDPLDPRKWLFCPWHGKVRPRYFRVHFEWPRPSGQKKIKVMYFGPKITKK